MPRMPTVLLVDPAVPVTLYPPGSTTTSSACISMAASDAMLVELNPVRIVVPRMVARTLDHRVKRIRIDVGL